MKKKPRFRDGPAVVAQLVRSTQHGPRPLCPSRKSWPHFPLPDAGQAGGPQGLCTEPGAAARNRVQQRLCLLQEQTELKIRASELRAKEEQLATEKEAVERERQELRLEKEKVKATALSLQLRAEEVEHMSKVRLGRLGAEATI